MIRTIKTMPALLADKKKDRKDILKLVLVALLGTGLYTRFLLILVIIALSWLASVLESFAGTIRLAGIAMLGLLIITAWLISKKLDPCIVSEEGIVELMNASECTMRGVSYAY